MSNINVESVGELGIAVAIPNSSRWEKKMKYKVLVAMLMMATISMITACGKKEVDYSLDGNTEESIGSTASNDASLKQFQGEETWNDQWVVTDSFGEKRNITIKAEVNVPALESMRVIESQSLGRDEKFKKQCLESFFGADTEYYYHEEEDYTREELEKWLPEELEMIEEASDTRKVAEEFESASCYAAYRNEVLYEIALTDSCVSISPNWDETAKCGPESLRDYKYVDFGGIYQEGSQNECVYSMEEAEEIANGYMEKVGLSAMECTSRESLTWCGNNVGLDDEGENEYACYGYMFQYETVFDEISLKQFPSSLSYQTRYYYTELKNAGLIQGDLQSESPSMGSGTALVIVADEGVHTVTIINADVIERASNSVGLLPLDTIKEILQAEVTTRTEMYYIENFDQYNYLGLIYFTVSDNEQGRVSIVPTWCFALKQGLSAPTYYHPIFVNAIDGSIIHYADAEWEGVDATPCTSEMLPTNPMP